MALGTKSGESPAFTRPVPYPGCAECAAFERQFIHASTPGTPEHDPSKATDTVVLMRRHKKAAHRGVDA